MTPLFAIVYLPQVGSTALMIVSRNGHTDLAKMLLANQDINVNLQDKVCQHIGCDA